MSEPLYDLARRKDDLLADLAESLRDLRVRVVAADERARLAEDDLARAVAAGERLYSAASLAAQQIDTCVESSLTEHLTEARLKDAMAAWRYLVGPGHRAHVVGGPELAPPSEATP